MDFLKKDLPRYAGLLQCIIRGTARILENDEHGVFLQDTVSGVYMLACDSMETGRAWIMKHDDEDYALFMFADEEVFAWAKDYLKREETLEVIQYVYEDTQLPESDWTIYVRPVTLAEMPLIQQHYHVLTEEELREIITQEHLFFGVYNDEIIGFIGMHLEGSMGLLEVFEEHRRKGYAVQLESWMIAYMRNHQLIPYGQVVKGNTKSIQLQKKIGLKEVKEHLFWLI